jgi:hypothetical protein
MFGVMIALGASTYTVVFNLNNLTRAVYRQYEAAKKPWIKRMKDEHDQAWSTRAERYNGFKIKRFDTSPSEWLVIWYILTWPLRQYLLKSFQQTDDHVTPQQPKELPESAKPAAESNNLSWFNDHPPFPPSEESKCLLRHLHEPISCDSISLSSSTAKFTGFFVAF